MTDEVIVPAEPTPTPAAPALAPEPAPAGLPPGLAERVAAAKVEPQAPTPAPADKPTSSLQTLLGDELSADPAAATSIALVERIAGDKLDLDRAFGKAVEEGDLRFVDERYLKETLGEADAKLLLQEAAKLMQQAEGLGEALKAELLKDVPGGQATMDQAATIFNSVASESTRRAIAKLLDSGDKDSMQYAVQQVLEIAKNSGQLVLHNQQPIGAPGALKGLSRAEYTQAIQKRNLSDAEYEQLKAQRKLGMSQGL